MHILHVYMHLPIVHVNLNIITSLGFEKERKEGELRGGSTGTGFRKLISLLLLTEFQSAKINGSISFEPHLQHQL